MNKTKILYIEYTIKILDYNTNEVIEILYYPNGNKVNYPIIPNIGDTITLWKRKGKVKKLEREISLITEWETDYITVYIE